MNFDKKALLILSLLSLSLPVLAGPAADSCRIQGNGVLSTSDERYRTDLTCIDGAPSKRLRFFKENGALREEMSFKKGAVTDVKSHSLDGTRSNYNRFHSLVNGNIIKETYDFKNGQIGLLTAREELSGFDPESSDVQLKALVVRRWVFKTAAPTQIDYVAVYSPKDQKRILAKEYYDSSGRYTGRILFTYKDGEEKPVRFQEFDAQENP
ncbi:MAG: hypothetical protein KF789_12240, partial [Bdellovibrionaceae bacterium]|nr:hypothetical protein [Pseudobdellovibrionaceae bacterium]